MPIFEVRIRELRDCKVLVEAQTAGEARTRAPLATRALLPEEWTAQSWSLLSARLVASGALDSSEATEDLKDARGEDPWIEGEDQ